MSRISAYADHIDLVDDLDVAQHEVYSILSTHDDTFEAAYHISRDCPQSWSALDAHIVFPGSFNHEACFWFSLHDFDCFSVSSSDILSARDLAAYWPLVEAADRDELSNFVKHNVFRARPFDESMTNIIDMTWVRRWKRSAGPSGTTTWMVKSRLCGRGFLDRQKSEVQKHSSTASRLSHRILCSIGVQMGYTFELYDISCAFLQGLKFSDMHKLALDLGVELPAQRSVFVTPPRNVWRHFREMRAGGLAIPEHATQWHVLECLKAIYGLVDAPLLWQMALTHYLKRDLAGIASSFDDNCIFWISGTCVELIVTIHVDDLLVTGTADMMVWLHSKLEQRFGAVKRNVMPFVHLGVRHSILQSGSLFLDQQEYLMKIPKVHLTDSRRNMPDSTLLSASEHHSHRSLLCSMLWVTVTRIDMVLEVVLLQSSMVTPTLGDLKAANALLAKSQKNAIMNGLHFHQVAMPVRINGIHDASAANQRSSYAYEGLLVLLMNDSTAYMPDDRGYLSAGQSNAWSGVGQPLAHSARKSKRISNSTSHGETLAAINASQLINLVSLRFTELYCLSTFSRNPTTKYLLHLQTHNLVCIPCDITTDCMDLYELVCGLKGIPSDKSQRLCILCLREDRLSRRIRYVVHCPTANMLADGLTKPGVFPRLLHFCTTGIWQMEKTDMKPLRLKMPAPRRPFTEADLLNSRE